ncbi:hypothetical protein [uncultured Mitsuokella sp.]|uniref:hypothetical protein n=1 Tax=uncultured Mitsuokella sp. TaxID=453120 RepID=UPI0026DC575F|nr:hypothetical protein [uncultured Mitsuokella sp.]
MKRYPILAVLLLLLWSQVASAQVVVAEGEGADRQSALRDAARNAVEQVVGTLVDARTLVQGASVQLDAIYARSQGFVRDVQVLEERPYGDGVRVKARMDVNTDADAPLLADLSMVMNLNDPRIAVIVSRADGSGRDASAEAALNQKLVALGFHHVVDPSLMASLQGAERLGNLAAGGSALAAAGRTFGADYLVLGELTVSGQTISLPDGQGGYSTTLLKTGNARLTGRILRFDTGAVLGTFETTGRGAGNSLEVAEQAAAAAAQKMEERFRHLSTQLGQTVELQVFTSDQEAIRQLVTDLKRLGIVQTVYLRESEAGKTIVSVETVEPAAALMDRLKAKSRLGIFIDSVTSASARLAVSRR